jgi:hypothetical protein
MTDFPLDVAAHEHGWLRLFAIEPDDPALRAAVESGEDARLARVLGAQQVAASRAETVRRSDLGEMGFAGYLSAGYEVPKAKLDAARDTLGKAPAHLLILPSSAFGGEAQRLAPVPPLRPLVAFQLDDPMPERERMAPYEDPQASAASPAGALVAEPRTGRSRSFMPVLLTVAGAIVLLLILWALL